jgi:hypothetical protein
MWRVEITVRAPIHVVCVQLGQNAHVPLPTVTRVSKSGPFSRHHMHVPCAMAWRMAVVRLGVRSGEQLAVGLRLAPSQWPR